MDADEFRIRGKEMVDYIADYLENIRDRRVYPDVAPGYLHKLLPETAPETGESWQDIFKDVDRAIMPGVLNWQSPHMHAYFPALTSYPSILGEMLASGLNNLTFTWASSPAGTELETIAMNWLGKMIGLPDVFLNVSNESLGGGVIQTTASEATLVSLLAARTRSLLELAELNPEVEPAELSGHLIAYCSDQAHSSVEKAGLIGLVRMRYIESDNNQCMRGPKLEEAILKDKEKGMVPFWVCATLGTTGSVAFDNLEEVSQVCQRHGAWLHCDAAYAGSAFICPEYRHWLKGVENADSLAFNPSKWLMVNFDCTAMWVKHSKALHRTFNVNPIYLRHENSGKAIDYMLGIKSRKPQIKKRYLISRHPLSVSVKQTAIPTEKDTTKLGSRDPENLDSKLKNYEKTSSDSDYDSNSSNFDSISNIELNNDIYNRRDDSETQIVEKCERNHVKNRYFDSETDSDETPVDQCRRIEIIAKELPPLGSQNKTQSFLNTSENEEDVCTLLTEMLNSKVDVQHKDAPYIQKEVVDKEVNYERNKDTSDLYFKPRSHSKYIKLEDSTKTEFSHWQIPLSRRFRALKLWFVLRSYGVAGLQKHIRESVRLAQKFEALVLADTRFEIPQPRNLGMVVFRLKGDNTLTECLLKRLNARGNIHCVPAIFKSVYVIRFTVTSQMTTNQDIIDDWAEIRLVASCILKEIYGCESGNIFLPKKPRVTLKETKDMNKTFGTSLLLANSPMSPKIVNGTYAAIRDYEQVLNSCAHTFSILKMEPKDSPEMRRRIRGIKMVGKKFSLDSCLDMVQGLVAASEEKNVQTLPLMREDEREDLVSNGSSPIDFSSQIPSPNSACADGHHLFVQPPATRQYRSKSVDITLSGLANNESASVTFDMAKNKIIITPTKDEQTKSDKTANLIKDEAFCADSSSGDEEKANIDKNVNLENDKITIIGPGSYIKKIIQQFSENSFDCDPEMAKRGENSESLTKSPSFRERADALCKKCLHFKGKVNK